MLPNKAVERGRKPVHGLHTAPTGALLANAGVGLVVAFGENEASWVLWCQDGAITSKGT